jgi:hypothetical protein
MIALNHAYLVDVNPEGAIERAEATLAILFSPWRLFSISQSLFFI